MSPGLLVLTPPARAEGEELAQHRRAAPRHRSDAGDPAQVGECAAAGRHARRASGAGLRSPASARSRLAPDFSTSVDGEHLAAGSRDTRWRAADIEGRLPAPGAVPSGAGVGLVPLVIGENGRILAAYVDDGGFYPDLAELAPASGRHRRGERAVPCRHRLRARPARQLRHGRQRRARCSASALIAAPPVRRGDGDFRPHAQRLRAHAQPADAGVRAAVPRRDAVPAAGRAGGRLARVPRFGPPRRPRARRSPSASARSSPTPPG